jgi:hypothetical protein
MFRPLLGHHQVNLQNIKKEARYLIKTLSIVAKQKVLLFTVNFMELSTAQEATSC